MPLLLVTIALILAIFSIGMLAWSVSCLRKANEHLAQAIEMHLETHAQDRRLYDQFGLPPEDWDEWRPDR